MEPIRAILFKGEDWTIDKIAKALALPFLGTYSVTKGPGGFRVAFDEPVQYQRKLSEDLGPGVEFVVEKDPEGREPGDPMLRIVYEEGVPKGDGAVQVRNPVTSERSVEALAEELGIDVADLIARTPIVSGRRDILMACASEPVEKDSVHKGRIKIVTTTDSVDRMGDVLTVSGWVLKHYSKNPIVLFNHEYGAVGDSPPAQARAMDLIVQKHRIVAVDQFHLKTRFNSELYEMYVSDPPMMNTASVGFWPLERPEAIQDKDGRTTGYTFGAKDYLEHSLVAVPAQPEAYQLAVRKGLVRARTVEYLTALSLSFAGSSRSGAGEKSHNADRDAQIMARALELRARALNLSR